MAAHDGNTDVVTYVQFSARPKKGQMLRYLLVSQVRKRFLEQPAFEWRRQVKGAALTGNPELVTEFYHLRVPWKYADAIKALQGDAEVNGQSPQVIQQEIEAITSDPETALRPQRFRQMDYIRDVPGGELAQKPYLLYTTITLDNPDTVVDFSRRMSRLLPVFKQSGLTLVVAGQKLDEEQISAQRLSAEILNIWQFQEAEEVEGLMMRLSDNEDYFALNNLGGQDQHIFRNVSRHYQFFPLMTRAHPSAGAHP